ncbi:hypothetical protein J6590_022626 [Homalodisca vitripennis]|nr:hypothetical protein J6590_022626 [Homalodisca vitripennis]
MINKLCYWSIGFYIPPLGGVPTPSPARSPAANSIAANAKWSFTRYCYITGKERQSPGWWRQTDRNVSAEYRRDCESEM